MPHMEGIFINGEKAKFHPEDILDTDASQYTEEIGESVAAYLTEHLTNPSNPPIDTSLSIAGAAADAKETGDQISQLKSELTDIRVGADGTTYNSAGAAVRGQISDLNENLSLKTDAFVNLYSYFDEGIETGGYYNNNGTWHSDANFFETGYIAVEEGCDYCASTWFVGIQTQVVFYDASKNYLTGAYTITNGYVTIPNGASFIRFVIAKQNRFIANFVKGRTAPSTPLPYNKQVFMHSGVGDDVINNHFVDYKVTPYAQTTGQYMKNDGTIDTSIATGKIAKYKDIDGIVYLHGSSTLGSVYSVAWLVKNDAMVMSLWEGSYSSLEGLLVYVPATYEIWLYYTDQRNNYITAKTAKDAESRDKISEIELVLENSVAVGSQWNGKTWYCYGTSISNISSEGKYPTYLAQMSGMTLVNKGISGGGIGNLGAYSTGQVYNAICNITDGKLNADLITLETGANDVNAEVPLGTIYDAGQTTLAGCLNDCLRYLQKNTNAQIAVTVSPANTTTPAEANKYYEWAQMVEQICHINRVHFLNGDNNMGYAKIADSTKGSMYVTDSIHQTQLGGYIMAQNLWYQLRNIPLFYIAIPN